MQLIGREMELAEIERLHRKHATVSLTGAPGIGKTVLAQAVAATRRATIVALGATPLESVPAVVARALGVNVPASAPPSGASGLAGRELGRRGKHLLVLDDADAALDLLAKELLPALVREAPLARIVVTSRGRLKTGAAARVDVGPLTEAAAVKLFVHHASIALPGYRKARGAADVVGEIVRTLDGNPLAIELCASRLSVLDEHALAAALAADAGAFAEGAGAARGRSLRQAFRVSLDRLSADDVRMLAACAIFRGPFDLEGAVAVSAEKRDARTTMRVATRLERLEEASLLRVHEGDEGSRARTFSIDPSLRAFVIDRESESERSTLVRRLAQHLATPGSAFGPRTATEPESHENERWAAVEWALDAGEIGLAGRVLLAAARGALARGPLGIFVDRAEAVLAKPRALANDVAAELHLACGTALVFRGRRDEALAHFERAAKLARTKETARVRALAESKIGLVRGLKGETKPALARFTVATEHAERDGDPWARGIVQKDLANVLSEHGRDEEAVVHLGRARDLFRAARDVREEAFVRMMLGSRLVDAGRVADARRDCTAALALFEAAGDRRSQGWTRVLLGIVELEEGKPEAARRHLEKALEHVRAVGDGHTEGLALSYLGNVALEQRMLADAEEAYGEALVLLERAGDKGAEAMCLAGAAVVDALSGHASAARDRISRARRLVAKDARSARREAIALLARVVDPAAKSAAITTSTEEVRFAERIAALASGGGSAPRPAATEWLVAADGRSLKDPSGSVVRVDPKGPSARIVQHLAEERLRHPGRAVPLGIIVGAAWPGESMIAAAAKNRVHVTLARLRRAGLDALLVRDDDGYLFDPQISLRIAAKGEVVS